MSQLESGWMPGVERVPFREFGHSGVALDGMYPRALVHHVMTGYFSGARDMALTYPVGAAPSWHFSIARDGRVMQHISIWDTGWHCGIDSMIVPDNVVHPLVQGFRRQFGRDPNSWTIGVEHEGFSEPTYFNGKRVDDYVYGSGAPWPREMVEASIRVQRWIWHSCQWLVDLQGGARYDRFLTHAMINPVERPNDPGAFWDATVWADIVNGALVPPDAPRVEPPPPVVTVGLSQDAKDAFEQIALWANLGRTEQQPWQQALEQTRLWGGNVEAAQGGK